MTKVTLQVMGGGWPSGARPETNQVSQWKNREFSLPSAIAEAFQMDCDGSGKGSETVQLLEEDGRVPS